MEYGLSLFTDKRTDFLGFLRTRYSLFHLSNIFFRDLHYGVMAFLEMHGFSHAYTPSEDLTRRVISTYEKEGLLLPIDPRTWMLNYQPFRKAPAKQAAAAATPKPVADAKSPTPKPAVASAASPAASPSRPASMQETPVASPAAAAKPA